MKLNTLKQTLPQDFVAGVVISLVALPLCLGIALASSAPLISGLTSGIIGGIVVALLSKSHTSVSGPAAGLTAVVATQSSQLESFENFLVAVSLAGLFQILLGYFKAGKLAIFFPSSVIKGLLAAIGVILILKQIPHLFGHDPDWVGNLTFKQADGENTFSEIIATYFDIHAGASIIGLFSIALLVMWPKLPLAFIPAPLVVVCLALVLNMYLNLQGTGWVIESNHLVNVPLADSMSTLFGQLPRPEWSAVLKPQVWSAAITLALVATLETLLNLEAVDKIDPQKRKSPPNQELLAQGVGNCLCGLLGALPVTSVIIRSSVNISSGGKTKTASFIHGMILLLAIILFPLWLNKIPLSCLAAILLVTGFKLANPKLFKQMYKEGWNAFLPFVITVTSIVLTDLLTGIITGLITAVLFLLYSQSTQPIECEERTLENGHSQKIIKLGTYMSFLNQSSLREKLEQLKSHTQIVIDASKTQYIDKDIIQIIKEFQNENHAHIELKLIGLEDQIYSFRCVK
jgi:MFS superfamily sulfate permease-like transporter